MHMNCVLEYPMAECSTWELCAHRRPRSVNKSRRVNFGLLCVYCIFYTVEYREHVACVKLSGLIISINM